MAVAAGEAAGVEGVGDGAGGALFFGVAVGFGFAGAGFGFAGAGLGAVAAVVRT